MTSIAPNDDVDEDEDDGIPMGRGNRPAGYTAPAALLNDVAQVIAEQSKSIDINLLTSLLLFCSPTRIMIRLRIVDGRRLARRKMNIARSEGASLSLRNVSILLLMVSVDFKSDLDHYFIYRLELRSIS